MSHLNMHRALEDLHEPAAETCDLETLAELAVQEMLIVTDHPIGARSNTLCTTHILKGCKARSDAA